MLQAVGLSSDLEASKLQDWGFGALRAGSQCFAMRALTDR